MLVGKVYHVNLNKIHACQIAAHACQIVAHACYNTVHACLIKVHSVVKNST